MTNRLHVVLAPEGDTNKLLSLIFYSTISSKLSVGPIYTLLKADILHRNDINLSKNQFLSQNFTLHKMYSKLIYMDGSRRTRLLVGDFHKVEL